jgi:ABC-type xylose transport system permease subunit
LYPAEGIQVMKIRNFVFAVVGLLAMLGGALGVAAAAAGPTATAGSTHALSTTIVYP